MIFVFVFQIIELSDTFEQFTCIISFQVDKINEKFFLIFSLMNIVNKCQRIQVFKFKRESYQCLQSDLKINSDKTRKNQLQKNNKKIRMFTVEALYPFSSLTLKQQQVGQKQQKQSEQNNTTQKQAQDQKQDKDQNQQQGSEISYLSFQKGDKILVIQSYENGWWYGNKLKEPEIKGFFPSNYVQVSSKPKPPPPPPQDMPEQSQLQEKMYDMNEDQGIDWVQNQLKNITQGPVKSDYYLGIKGYKNVKIDDKNQNILKGDHVKFDVSTGLAKVPVKDQAPAAKAVRQMGYYFDYHQWVQERNKHPGQYKARPDPKKKKIKKLNLKGMK